MKTTIKLGAGRAIVVSPGTSKDGTTGVRVDLTMAGVVIGGDVLTADAVGVLINGLEHAAMAAGVVKACPHARICDQEGECVSGCTQRLGAAA